MDRISLDQLRKVAPVLWLLCFMGAATSSHSQALDGNTLLEVCSSKNDGSMQGFCIGYILGTWEGMNWGAFQVWNLVDNSAPIEAVRNNINISLSVCAPVEAQNSQITDVVVKYLDGHPESRHENARGLINEALSKAFPCGSP